MLESTLLAPGPVALQPSEPATRLRRAEGADGFVIAAAGQGYDIEAADVMMRAAASMGLGLVGATEWLDAGVTPWAVSLWRRQGFADGAEAREYRRWGLQPEAAYWARRDGMTAVRLARYRMLISILASARFDDQRSPQVGAPAPIRPMGRPPLSLHAGPTPDRATSKESRAL